jgi:hypothetical protein
MSEHTPGPWRVGKPGSNSVVADVPVPGINGSDATDYYNGHLVAESVAPQNVALIAAAPDLLTGLERLLEHYVDLVRCGDCGNWNPEEEAPVKAARAAIAKAEGRANG